jgi:branched-chain amino acid transport system substrate-binding protein
MNRRELIRGASVLALTPWAARAQAARPPDRQTARPLKIGVLNDMSSVYSDFQGQGSVVAAQLATDDYSAKLGVAVEIVSADHQNKPDIGAAIARKWFDEDHVDVIMDLPNSAVALAVLGVASEKNKGVIGSGAGSSVLTGPKCSKNFVHWTYDTYELGNAMGRAVTRSGGKSWYFITADYSFGKVLRDNCATAVEAEGGKIVGEARHPLNTADFSSFVLQAQASGANVVAFANAGGDLNNAIKQAHEFGLPPGQQLATFVLNITNVPGLGLETLAGSLVATPFYWDFNEGTRAFGKRFQEKTPKKMMPNDMHAGMYAATAHLLKAYAETKSADDGVKLIDAMKALPTDDPLFGKGSIRADGRHLHPVYLMSVKTPAESKGEWDAFKPKATIPADEAFRPLEKGACPFIKA